MDLVERYVSTVRPLLPLTGRDDICAEITDMIRSRLEERQAELGRKPTKAEEEAVIQSFGHPVEMAARYGPQKSLIGPTLFPAWWLIARVIVAVTAIGNLGRGAVFAFMARTPPEAVAAMGRAWADFCTMAGFLIGVLTIAMALIEHFNLKLFENWRVRELRPMTFNMSFGSMSYRKIPGRLESGVSLFFNLLAAVWWTTLPFLPSLWPAYQPAVWMGMAGIQLADVCFPLLWGMALAGTLLQCCVHLADFARPLDERTRRAWRVATSVVTLSLSAVILVTGDLLFVTAGSDERLAKAALAVNLVIRLTAAVIAVVAALQLAWNGWRLMRAGTVASA
jgi:hypothetical protein